MDTGIGTTTFKRSNRDRLIIVLLLIGGIFFGFGFIGAVLLWLTPTWGKTDKIIGTLMPFESLAFFEAYSNNTGGCKVTGACASTNQISSLSLVVMGVTLVLFLATAVRLVRQGGRS